MTNAQTEARAIAWEVRGAQLHRVFLDETEARELAGRFNGAVTSLVHATALAAKDAELAAAVAALQEVGQRLHHQRNRAERAEAQLAEARKALNYLNDAVAVGLPDQEISRRAQLLVPARRAREQGGE